MTLAAAPTPFDWIGTVKPPVGGSDYSTGLVPFINGALWLVFIFFGLYAFYMFIMAAYTFINSKGDPKNIEKAQNMITYSVIGLVLLVSSFMFAGIIGVVFFGSWDFVLDPTKAIQCTIAEQKVKTLQTCNGIVDPVTRLDRINAARKTGTAQQCTDEYNFVKDITCP
ncbi:MAG: pilin [Candidatus Roizmanbacteria bacterium]|nr:pilin [Candidatus Roizmanbacteria bacterium]